jgi:hypothetical protein
MTTVYRAKNHGYLYELWTQESQGGKGNLTKSPNPDATKASGDPSIYLNTNTEQPLAFYRGTDGHVHCIYWIPGGAGHDKLSETAGAPKAAEGAIPVGYFTPTDMHHVVYRSQDNGEGGHSPDGDLHVLYWAGAETVQYDGPLTAMVSHAPLARGNPSAYLDTNHGVNLVVYRGTDDCIHRIYWDEAGVYGHYNLTTWGLAIAPKAAGDPFAYYTAHNDTHQVAYRTQNGEIYELWWKGNLAVTPRNLSAEAPGAPRAASDPFAYYCAGLNGFSSKHVFYAGLDGRLHELTWWLHFPDTAQHTDLTVAAHAPNGVVGRPSGVVVEPYEHHIFYRGTNNHIHEIRWEVVEVPYGGAPSLKRAD